MILVWNCQGAKSALFINALKTLIRIHGLHIIALLEPRISGERADRTIKRIGFQNSYRVEATGFSGGIWIMWDDFWHVQILGRLLNAFTVGFGMTMI